MKLTQRWEWLAVGGIALLTAVLRLAFPTLTEFKADEARLLTLALEMADGRFALRGISSSVGVPNFPMSVWLYAIPVALWPHPIAATFFTGLLNSLAVLLTYWLTRRYWGVNAAIAAALLFAVSPWAVIFSRKIWAQNLLPLFVMLWAISAALAFVERRPRWIWLHFVALAVAVQIHLAAMALIPATLLYLLLFRRRVEWRQAAIGAGLAGVTAVPFLLYLWQNRADLRLPSGGGGESAAWSLTALRDAWLITGGGDIHALAGPELYQSFLPRVPGLEIVNWLWGGLALAGLLWLGWFAWGQRGQPHGEIALIILIWALTPPLFFTLWRGTPVFIHYFIALLPAPYIAAGALFARWLSGLRRPGARAAAWGGLALLVAVPVWALATLLALVGQTATPGGFGGLLGLQLAAAERAQRLLAEQGAAEILVVGQGERPDLDEFPAVWEALLRGVPHRYVDGRASALFPAAPAVVVVQEGMGEVNEVYGETAVFQQTVPLRQGEGALTLFLLPGGPPAPETAFAAPILLANWVHLLGYDGPMVEVGGETAVWRLHWRAANNPDPADYHIFNHLLDAEGRRIAQTDGAAFAPWQWRAGDVVVSQFTLDWSEPAASLRSGMYRYPSLEPVLLLDVAGNPYDDGVEVEVAGSR
jgi:4-amino-4-deoxy-L-arabinose transferase-like glycosyltransferase